MFFCCGAKLFFFGEIAFQFLNSLLLSQRVTARILNLFFGFLPSAFGFGLKPQGFKFREPASRLFIAQPLPDLIQLTLFLFCRLSRNFNLAAAERKVLSHPTPGFFLSFNSKALGLEAIRSFVIVQLLNEVVVPINSATVSAMVFSEVGLAVGGAADPANTGSASSLNPLPF